MMKFQQAVLMLIAILCSAGQQITCESQSATIKETTTNFKPQDKVEGPPLIFPSINDPSVIKVNKTLKSLEEFDKSSVQGRGAKDHIDVVTSSTPTSSTVGKVNQNSVTDTEVDDLNKPAISDETRNNIPERETVHNEDDLAKMIFTNLNFGVENTNIVAVDKSDNAGLIQTEGNEDDAMIKNNETSADGNFDSMIGEQIVVDGVVSNGITGGQIAPIVAGVFVVLCVIGYTAMLMWRRYLENKYGNREMLVNEDFYDPNDLRHFSL